MTLSILRSTRQLIAAAAPATSAMPTVAKNTVCGGGSPGTARNMPMTAQNTMSDTTRGLVRATYWRIRFSVSVAEIIDDRQTRGSGLLGGSPGAKARAARPDSPFYTVAPAAGPRPYLANAGSGE